MGPTSDFAPDDQTEELPTPQADGSSEAPIDKETTSTNFVPTSPAIASVDESEAQVPMELNRTALPATVAFSVIASTVANKSKASSHENCVTSSPEFKHLNFLKQQLKDLLRQSH